MLIENLLKKLPKNSYKLLNYIDYGHEIYGLKMLTKHQKTFQQDTLYFGDFNSLSLREASEVFNLLTFSPVDIDQLENYKNKMNLIQIQSDYDPYEIYNLLQDSFLVEQQTSIKIKRLVTALVSNIGIDYMVEEAYKIFKNPIFIVDNSFRYIAKNIGSDQIIAESRYDKIIHQELELGGIKEEGIDYIKANNLDAILTDMNMPYYYFNQIYKKGSLLFPIRIQNIEVGHMMLLEEFQTITPSDHEIFYQFSFLVAQELQKSAFYSNNKGQLYSYFLIDLLKAESPSSATISRRLSMLKYDLKETLFICAISTVNQENINKQLTVLTKELQAILTGHIHAIFNQHLIILFNLKEDAQLSTYTLDHLLKSSHANALKIGISNPFSDITEIKTYYQQAVKSIEYAASTGSQNGLYYYKDYSYIEMLTICQSHNDLINFCDPDLLRLYEHDKANNSDLLMTLYHYLEESANSKRTAKALYIHKNTLHYRLDKIKAILNNPLQNGEDLFKYHLSFRILTFLNLFTKNIKDEYTEND